MSRSLASTLPCLLARLVEVYSKSHQLKSCEIKINQSWRRASGKAVREHVQIFAKYFPELSSLSNSLEDYSLCERHYNQIVASDSLLQTLQTGDSTSTKYGNQYKRRRNTIHDNLSQPSSEPKVHDVGIQVSLPDLDLLTELRKIS